MEYTTPGSPVCMISVHNATAQELQLQELLVFTRSPVPAKNAHHHFKDKSMKVIGSTTYQVVEVTTEDDYFELRGWGNWYKRYGESLEPIFMDEEIQEAYTKYISDNPYFCYECDNRCSYVFDDGKCKDCTRVTTPEEVRGDG